MVKVIRIIAVIVWISICGITAWGQDARSILRRSSSVYTNLNSYDFDALNEMSFEFNGVKYQFNIRWELARGETPDLALTKQARGLAFTQPTGEGVKYPDLDIVFPYDPSRFGENVKSAKILRQEILTVDGKGTSCYVIEVNHSASAESNIDDPPAETVWIDKSTYLVYRLSYQSAQRSRKSQAALDVRNMVSFSSYKLNVNPPAWLISANADFAKQTATRRAAKVGKPAPDFKVRDLNGAEVTLSSLRNKVVLLEFWDTWCAPCRAEIPIILKLEREWANKGLVVVRITDENADDVRAFQKDAHQSFRTFVNGANVLRQYEIYARPVVITIDKTGAISAYDETLLTEAQLLDRLKTAGLLDQHRSSR